jgi:hypothetical protein
MGEGLGLGVSDNSQLPSAKFEPVPLTDLRDLLNADANDGSGANAANELDQWERFALKRLGKSHSRSFEVRHIPSEIAFELSASLLAAITAAVVQSAFAAARITLASTP